MNTPDISLLFDYKNGNETAGELLVKEYEPLIKSVITKYRRQLKGIEKDAYQHGVMIFLKLCMEYNPVLFKWEFDGYIKRMFEYEFTNTIGEI